MKNLIINNGIKAIIDNMTIGEYLFRFYHERFLVSDVDSNLFQIKRLR